MIEMAESFVCYMTRAGNTEITKRAGIITLFFKKKSTGQ
jgi:hypothetical protein